MGALDYAIATIGSLAGGITGIGIRTIAIVAHLINVVTVRTTGRTTLADGITAESVARTAGVAGTIIILIEGTRITFSVGTTMGVRAVRIDIELTRSRTQAGTVTFITTPHSCIRLTASTTTLERGYILTDNILDQASFGENNIIEQI